MSNKDRYAYTEWAIGEPHYPKLARMAERDPIRRHTWWDTLCWVATIIMFLACITAPLWLTPRG